MSGDLIGWQSGATAPTDGTAFIWARWLPRTLDLKTRRLSEWELDIDLVRMTWVSVDDCEDDRWTWVGRYTTRDNREIYSGYWIAMPPVPVESY